MKGTPEGRPQRTPETRAEAATEAQTGEMTGARRERMRESTAVADADWARASRDAAAAPPDQGATAAHVSRSTALPTDREVSFVKREPTLSIQLVRILLESAERAGIARAELLRLARFDAERLKLVEDRVARSEFHAMCELALDLSGDPALGLHGGEATTGGGHLIPYLMANCACLRQALETLRQVQVLVSDDLLFQLVERAGSASVRFPVVEGASSRVARFMAELMSASMLRMVRRFAQGALPLQVCFAYRAPAHLREYTRVFGGVERFEHTFTGIVFDRALLEMRSQESDQELYDALRTLAVQRVNHQVLPIRYADRVTGFLSRHETPAKLSMAAVARRLGLSVRSLRRRLTLEGVTYKAVSHAALAARAKRHLSIEQRTIQETAYLLGYGDSGAFHRAFKRWTGMTPSAVATRF